MSNIREELIKLNKENFKRIILASRGAYPFWFGAQTSLYFSAKNSKFVAKLYTGSLPNGFKRTSEKSEVKSKITLLSAASLLNSLVRTCNHLPVRLVKLFPKNYKFTGYMI